MLKRILTLSTLALTLSACGASSSTESSRLAGGDGGGQDQSNEVVIESATATPVNGGINPSAFALKIKATVLAGGNSCQASTQSITLTKRKIGRTIFVSAVKTNVGPHAVCTLEWAPVYQDLGLTVLADSRDVDTVVLKNVGSIGHNVATDSL